MLYPELDRIEQEELDRLRETLVYILLKDSELEFDEAYSIVFHNGSNITWH